MTAPGRPSRKGGSGVPGERRQSGKGGAPASGKGRQSPGGGGSARTAPRTGHSAAERDRDLVVDFDPSRPVRLLPPRETGGWAPGDGQRAPDAVLGTVVELPGPTGEVAISFPDAVQPRTAMTLTAWVCWGERVGAYEEPAPDPSLGQSTDPSLDPSAGPNIAPSTGPGVEKTVAEPVLAVHLTRRRSRHTRVDIAIGATRPGVTVDIDHPAVPPPAAGPALDQGDWHHLALAWDGPARTLRILLDGRLVAERPTPIDHLPFRRGARIAIVKEQLGVCRLRVGPVRLHRRLRTPAELVAERLADLAAHPTVDESAPLAFRLSDAADEPTLSITDDDAPGRALHVVLENRSPFPVTLPRARAAREQRLELRFRPGCLAGEARHWVDPGSPRWSVESVEQPDGGVSLFLASVEAMELGPGRTLAITLDHVRAAGELGSHGTTVELHHPHPHHPSLWSTRTSVARVVGRRGRRHSPLRFGVAGDGVVVNDGSTSNTLRLYVANSSPSRSVLLRAPVGGVGTALVLGFDTGEPGDGWALATTDQLLAATMSVRPRDWRIEVAAQDEAPEWVLTPTRDQELGPSERIEIVVAQLLTDLPPGRTRVSLRLENVPGYWDDDRSVDIEKSRVRSDETGLSVHGDLRVAGTVHDRYGELLPPGTIVMWHGSKDDIPDGWVLCDGHNGTPELVGRFVRAGAPIDPGALAGVAAPGRKGGSDDRRLTVEHLPSHAHKVEVLSPTTRNFISDASIENAATDQAYAPRSVIGRRASSGERSTAVHTGEDDNRQMTSGRGIVGVDDRIHDVGGGPQQVDLPAYYELCYIMKRFPTKAPS